MIKLVLTTLILCYFPQRFASQPLEMAVSRKKALLMSTGNDDSERFRTFIFRDNKKIVDAVNSDPDKTYKLQANAFAKLTQAEIRQRYLSLIPSSNASISLAKAIAQKKKKPKVLTSSTRSSGIAAAAASFSRSFMSPSALASPPEIDLSVYENAVLADVKQFLRKKKIPNSTIQQKIIPSYKYQSTSQVAIGNRRMLQQNIGGKDESQALEKMSQKDSQIKIKDVDWSCLSGSIRAQGDCGACYAFSTADNVGALLGIYHYQFHVQLSIQQLIDCSKNSLVFGCNGGFLQGALAQIMQFGVYYQYHYPYSSIDLKRVKQGICKDNTIDAAVQTFSIQNFQPLKRGDCEDFKRQLQKHPISIGIAGYKLALYNSGIFDGCDQDDDLDHAVLLVGYKKGKGWKIKNSWGTQWGQNGYAWLKEGNTCKVCEIGFFPIPAKNHGFDKYVLGQINKQCPPP